MNQYEEAVVKAAITWRSAVLGRASKTSHLRLAHAVADLSEAVRQLEQHLARTSKERYNGFAS